MRDEECENCEHDRAEAEYARTKERLGEVLVHAVSVIQGWHNMGVPEKQRSQLWDIYWRISPEMKPIREALAGQVEREP